MEEQSSGRNDNHNPTFSLVPTGNHFTSLVLPAVMYNLVGIFGISMNGFVIYVTIRSRLENFQIFN